MKKMSKRYLNLKKRPTAKNLAYTSGASSHSSKRQQKEFDDMKKLEEWNKLS